jgi:hypothetical protein
VPGDNGLAQGCIQWPVPQVRLQDSSGLRGVGLDYCPVAIVHLGGIGSGSTQGLSKTILNGISDGYVLYITWKTVLSNCASYELYEYIQIFKVYRQHIAIEVNNWHS